MPNRYSIGFTLIELLIVVAIIAILAAIAVPNFLEAQTRAKVSRTKADMRTMSLGLESYRLDHTLYPQRTLAETSLGVLGDESKMTTPIAYLTSIPRDPFRENRRDTGFGQSYFYIYHPNLDRGAPGGGSDLKDRDYMRKLITKGAKWHIYSIGPDGDHRNGFPNGPTVQEFKAYDPSNGTISYGNICWWGPGGGPGGY